MEVKKRGLLVVVLAFFLVFFLHSVQAAQGGCYTFVKGDSQIYCNTGVLDTSAQEDCAKYSDCTFSQYFTPGQDCTLVEDCEKVLCPVNCQELTWGVCKELGKTNGQEPVKISFTSSNYDSLYTLWCENPYGCCQFPTKKDPFCQFGLNKYKCEVSALQRGIDRNMITFDSSIGMTLKICNEKYCKLEILPATLTVGVYDTLTSKAISGALVTVAGTDTVSTTPASGKVQLTLSPQTYVLIVSKGGYTSVTKTLPLSSNASIELNFSLTAAEGTVFVKGQITDEQDRPLPQATLSWGEAADQRIATDTEGRYVLSELPVGEYTFSASAIGYQLQSKTPSLAQDQENILNFKLSKSSLPLLSGKTYVDKNNNLLPDPEEVVFGAEIYLDGEFRGTSHYPDGGYSFTLASTPEAVKESYLITSTFQDYQAKENILKTTEGVLNYDLKLLLLKSVGECSEDGPTPQKKVDIFSVQPVLGEKKVHLTWERPCPEVIGYTIEKYQDSVLTKIEYLAPAAREFEDEKVEWGKTYTYKIKANFISGLSSESYNEQSIALGDEPCEGRYNLALSEWETFCFGDRDELRKTVWTCDANNKLIPSVDCAGWDGVDAKGIPSHYYCAGIDEGRASCKDSGSCSLFSNPFGLYSSALECYGSMESNGRGEKYCYYDYSSSVVDTCKSCIQINNCFDYQSKEACQVNNCLDRQCNWIDGAANSNPLIDYDLLGFNLPQELTPETGRGYCVEENYSRDDRCYLCSPQVSLFENYFCTAEVCSGLGNCFSADQLKQCQACGNAPTADANCYTYTTERECTGPNQQEASSDLLGKIISSEDRCGWGTCFWKGDRGGTGTCSKDGNLDDQDDCLIFIDVGQQGACKRDNSAPSTKVLTIGPYLLSKVNTYLTFEASDVHSGDKTNAQQDNRLGKLGICWTSADPHAVDRCTYPEEFKEVSYSGRSKIESLNVNIVEMIGEDNAPNTYRVKFYSTDEFFNREDLQEVVIYVDTQEPQYVINEEYTTTLDNTHLEVFLEKLNEPATCIFDLSPILPTGTILHQEVSLESLDKKVVFENLRGIIYNLTVNCTDKLGNSNFQNKGYLFDLNQQIEVIYPQQNGKVSRTAIAFEVRTLLGSTCALYKSGTNEKVADFLTNSEGKEHRTSEIPSFIEGEYLGEYKVVCSNLLTQEVSEEYLNFQVIFTAPHTQITLIEGTREIQPQGNYWEEYFIRLAKVTLTCYPYEKGFDCDKTYYCLGAGCEFIGSPDYKESTGNIEITQTTPICYYSIDKGGNRDYQPICGVVRIEGFGITLDLPQPYYYQGEVWGIQKVPIFDWQFFTKVSSSECHFDYSPGFDYVNVPEHQKKLLNSEAKYLFSGFPESVFTSYSENGGVKKVYVKCINLDGEVSPEQKMNLEYDPSAPKIKEAFADPQVVLEETSTSLHVLTDDKSLCRFSDNSEGTGSFDYSSMEYSFPGTDNNTLETNHLQTFFISQVGEDGKKSYNLFVQCRNGAEDVSDLKEINFQVDYFSLGYILPGSLRPQGYVTSKNPQLILSTSKNAECEFRGGSLNQVNLSELEEFIPLVGEGSRDHSYSLQGLSDGYYQYPIRCVMNDHLSEAEINFKVDTQAPIISKVEEGNFSCGSEILKVMAHTTEENISGYYYEIYDLGDQSAYLNKLENETLQRYLQSSVLTGNLSKSSAITKISVQSNEASTGTKILVINGSSGADLPLEVSTNTLNLSHKYSVRLQGVDAAGNWGEFKESDGIYVVDNNYTSCRIDTAVPKVVLGVNSSCGLASPLVEINCIDETGCRDLKYGLSLESNSCQANLTYNGKKIPVDRKSWLCYFASDYVGNNVSGKELIDLPDSDGDGILNSCDNCSSTKPGAIVDVRGCSNTDLQIKENSTLSVLDTDGDGLPDNWENKYDAANCLFDYSLADSDDNNKNDARDDYDDDGYTNHQEYLYSTNPCSANDKPLFGGTVLPEPIKNDTSIKPLPLIPTPVTSSPTEGNIFSWVLLVIGLILTLGGGGYLVYYYNYAAPSSKSAPSTPSISTPTNYYSSRTSAVPSKGWAERFLQFRKSHEEKVKQKSRESFFGGFSTDSKNIPHVDKIINSKAPIEQKLQQVAQKYSEHKEELHPGLKPEEKNLFTKLENLAKNNKGPSLTDSLGKDGSKDLFNKLKQMSQKRKGEGK